MREHAAAATIPSRVGTDERFAMDESEFVRFYDATVRPLRGYLTRLSGNAARVFRRICGQN